LPFACFLQNSSNVRIRKTKDVQLSTAKDSINITHHDFDF